eukprot:7239538-Pyramimonas_sp.AAC.1
MQTSYILYCTPEDTYSCCTDKSTPALPRRDAKVQMFWCEIHPRSCGFWGKDSFSPNMNTRALGLRCY